MQPEPHWQEQTIARFMRTSRQYLGLTQRPATKKLPGPVPGKNRKLLGSLLIASSLGALFGNSAFATEANAQNEPAKRTPNSQSTRSKADNHAAHSHRVSVHGRYR